NAPGAQTLTASSASLVLTNLSPNTGYCFYVTQVCSATANPSPVTGPVCFTTTGAAGLANDEPCNATTLPTTGAVIPATTVGATTTAPNGYLNPDCTTATNPRDVWFVVTGTGTPLGLSTTGSAAGNVRVFSAAACTGPFTQLICQAAANNTQSVGTFVTPGLALNQRYYVLVAGLTSGAAQGAFTIAATPVTAARSSFSGELSVYPNPVAGGAFTLKLSGAGNAAAAEAELLDAVGQVVRRQTLALRGGAGEQAISTRGLAAGLYSLRLRVGAELVVRKLAIQ
ncbi:T9SS type A sorting domain-containing protein, partial [Hymenobacter jeollabukensis]